MCLRQDVSRHKIDSSQSAKNKLWEANAKRTAVEEKEGLPSHFYDFVITIYYSREQLEEIADAKCAKVRTKNALIRYSWVPLGSF